MSKVLCDISVPLVAELSVPTMAIAYSKYVSFEGEKVSVKRNSTSCSTSRPNLSHEEESCLVIQIHNLNFRISEHMQLL